MKLFRMEASPEYCPNCGAPVPEAALACPSCGACEETGWSEVARYQSLELPDEEFDYDEFVEAEFGKPSSVKPKGLSWFWWIAAIIVLLLFVLPYV